jgi:predicted adenine nucleotide alpha hydrolase (AANH) superfamily ATPase
MYAKVHFDALSFYYEKKACQNENDYSVPYGIYPQEYCACLFVIRRNIV